MRVRGTSACKLRSDTGQQRSVHRWSFGWSFGITSVGTRWFIEGMGVEGAVGVAGVGRGWGGGGAGVGRGGNIQDDALSPPE